MKALTIFKLTILCFLSFELKADIFNQEEMLVNMKVYGVQINVTDLEKAVSFYSEIIGFEVEKNMPKTGNIKLRNKGMHLYLNLVDRQRDIKYHQESQTILVLQTNNLDSVMAAYKAKGVRFLTGINENGVGYSVPFEDPFGNVISLLEQSKFPVPTFEEPRIYNVGYYMSDLEKAKDFYCEKLNFYVRSVKYLPALPLGHQDSTFAFMLHERKLNSTFLSPKDTQTLIIFSCHNIKSTIDLLKKDKVSIMPIKDKLAYGDGAKSYLIKDSYGNLSILIEKTIL